MATALQQLGERVQEASEEINRGKSPSGSIEIKQAKRISNRVAEEMESFAKLMEVEVPNFANAYSAAIDAYSRAVSIEHEMGAEGRQENVEKAKNSIRDFKTVLASSQSTMSSFRQIVAAMPRATSLLNRSKKRVIAILDRLEQELATALNLTGEIERVMSQHPDISGVWEEIPGINVIVVQDDGHFKAEASYLQNGSTVKWEMRGTITKEGAIEGVLAHTQPAGFASQTRRAKLAEDCKTIKGYAEFHGGGGHEWTWTKLYVKREH